jgi:hypothetical protein
MAMIIKTTLKNISSEYRDAQSWEDNGGMIDDWDDLEDCEYNSLLVTIVGEATDGYFDIKLPNGRFIGALNVHHLDGFEDNEHNRIIYNELQS